ncbi:MAG: M24 family metallopeptidase, partial [Terriglobales bacterium]
MDYRARQQALRTNLDAAGADALLVSHLPNLRYLTGFTGSNGLLLLEQSRATLFTDGRYREQARHEVEAARVVVPAQGDLWKAAAIRAKKLRRLALESERVTLAQRDRFLRHWPAGARGLKSATGWVEALRRIKAPQEVAAIRRAVELAAGIFPATLAQMRPGMPETAVAGIVEHALRQAGGEGLAFETIVAAGERGALVHGRPSSAKLPRRGFVVMDYGVILGGYVSDMTRTVHLGPPGGRARNVYAA